MREFVIRCLDDLLDAFRPTDKGEKVQVAAMIEIRVRDLQRLQNEEQRLHRRVRDLQERIARSEEQSAKVSQMERKLCDILRVRYDATLEEIQLMYRKQAVKVHPDKNGSEDAADRFKRLEAAYRLLIARRAQKRKAPSNGS